MELVGAVEMHVSTKMERFTLAYIAAVAARAGFEFVESQDDFDSVDGTLRASFGRRPRIDFQAKATSRDVLKADQVTFALSRKNYDELRIETITPRLLIVILMPSEEGNWLSHSEDELILRHCGYWVSLRGEPLVDNETSVTIYLPRAQRFDVDQLSGLMARAEGGPGV